MATGIEWVKNPDGSAGETWNPLAGCKEISPGCTNCYAATMARRLEAMGQEKYNGTTKKLANGKVVWTGMIQMAEDTDNDFTKPLRKRKPTMYFVNSMSDLFHKDVPYDFIDKVFAVMGNCPQHTFQVLSKRPERMAEYMNDPGLPQRLVMEMDRQVVESEHDPENEKVRHGSRGGKDKLTQDQVDDIRRSRSSNKETQQQVADRLGVSRSLISMIENEVIWKKPPIQWPLPGVWLGTSVEDQQRANERIPWLLSTPATVHFLSCEPLLGPVVFKDEWLPHKFNREPGCDHCETCVGRLNWLDVRERNHGPFLEWVIVGGESGHGARMMEPAWAGLLRDQCKEAGVPFFMKQMTKKAPIPDDLLIRKMPK